MKYLCRLGVGSFVIVLFVFSAGVRTSPIYAACSFSGTSGETYASSCAVDATSTEIYDYATNEANPNTWTLTLNTGAVVTVWGDATTQTVLNVGKIVFNGGRLVLDTTAGAKKVIKFGASASCWLQDADSDGYPTNFTCSPTQVDATYHRLYNLATTSNTDCCDPNAGNNSSVHQGQTSYFTTSITNCTGKTGTFDYNCDNVEDLNYTSQQLYACNACTNGSGYASVQCDRQGWIDGNRPTCGNSNTWFGQVGTSCSTGIICADPAQADCVTAGFVTQTTRTQGCQ